MRGLVLAVIFSLFLTTGLFAEGPAAKEPDTIFQKVAAWIGGGYKKDVKPIKKVEVFQDSADWVTGSSLEKKA